MNKRKEMVFAGALVLAAGCFLTACKDRQAAVIPVQAAVLWGRSPETAETVPPFPEVLSPADAEAVTEEPVHPSGWEETSSGWSFYGEDGIRQKGVWRQWNGDRYYLNEDGIMEQAAFRTIGTEIYHFGNDGRVDTGRFDADGEVYIAGDDGRLFRNGWIVRDRNWYYAGSDGKLFRNTRTPDGYTVDEEGRLYWTGNVYDSVLFSYSGAGYPGTEKLRLNTGTADRIWQYLKRCGWTSTAIAGVLGNFQQESGIAPDREEIRYHNGYGLGQWSYERRENLVRYAAQRGSSAADLYLQLDFLISEPDEKDFVSGYAHTEFRNAAAAAYEWGTGWEKYDFSDGSMDTVRIPYALAYYEHYVYGRDYLN